MPDRPPNTSEIDVSARTVKAGPFRVYRITEPRARRLAQVIPGLMLFGAGMALAIEAAFGVSPWTVFHQGVGERVGLSIGTVTVLTGLAILGVYPLIREPIGLGTVLNATIVGPALDLSLWLIPDLESLPLRILALVAAPVVIGLASGLYIGAGLGPGPRDGIMTWLERRGLRIWQARGMIELTVLGIGWALGGDVGIGTIWMALTIGWCVDRFLRPPLRIDQA